MDFKSLVESRYSVRSYTPQPVSEEALRYVLDCARLAPSAVNFQPWDFYVTTTADMRSRLTVCYQREWFVTAPCYVIITVRHDEEWVRKADNKPHGDIDVAIAAEHLCPLPSNKDWAPAGCAILMPICASKFSIFRQTKPPLLYCLWVIRLPKLNANPRIARQPTT